MPAMMNTAQTNQISTEYSDGVGFFDGGKNQNMIVRITPNSRPHWCRADGFQLQIPAETRHPLEAVR